jgi:hypothetical protein
VPHDKDNNDNDKDHKDNLARFANNGSLTLSGLCGHNGSPTNTAAAAAAAVVAAANANSRCNCKKQSSIKK